MHRELITRTQYLAELNRRLQSHPMYEEGMAFVPSPTGDPEVADAFDWVPTGLSSSSLFPEIAAQVHAMFRVQGR